MMVYFLQTRWTAPELAEALQQVRTAEIVPLSQMLGNLLSVWLL
jgi:hypothetical protein